MSLKKIELPHITVGMLSKSVYVCSFTRNLSKVEDNAADMASTYSIWQAMITPLLRALWFTQYSSNPNFCLGRQRRIFRSGRVGCMYNQATNNSSPVSFWQGPCHIELQRALEKIAKFQQNPGDKPTRFYLPNCDKHGFYKAKQVRGVSPPDRADSTPSVEKHPTCTYPSRHLLIRHRSQSNGQSRCFNSGCRSVCRFLCQARTWLVHDHTGVYWVSEVFCADD